MLEKLRFKKISGSSVNAKVGNSVSCSWCTTRHTLGSGHRYEAQDSSLNYHFVVTDGVGKL